MTLTTSVCVHLIYLIHKFHNLSWITEINELFHDILIYWDAPVFIYVCMYEITASDNYSHGEKRPLETLWGFQDWITLYTDIFTHR